MNHCESLTSEKKREREREGEGEREIPKGTKIWFYIFTILIFTPCRSGIAQLVQ
jgi:hypothetical protein